MPAFNSSLFKNERKERDNQPDFTGPGQISKADFMAIYDQVIANQYKEDDDGRIKLRVAGWKKNSKSGRGYISLSLSIDDYGVQTKPSLNSAPVNDDLF
jgi:uncharacterized protein (DUF736 family)|tara:strand:+ start:914 stop:1210 length:297 start_codon:yes stop_codon:yes gene_type:complete